MTHSISNLNSKELLKIKGIQLFSSLVETLKKLNITCAAFNEQGDNFFLKLNENQINEIFITIQQIINNIELSIEKEKKEKDPLNINQLWTFLVSNKLKYPINLFDHITEGDILEVYDTQNKQIFRSYEFFKHCTYSLDELFSIPWNELYYRDPKYITEYMRLLSILMENKSKDVLVVKTVPPHWVSQIHSNRKISHFLQTKIICLLYDANEDVFGYIHTQKILEQP